MFEETKYRVINRVKNNVLFAATLLLVCSGVTFALFQLQIHRYEGKATLFISESEGQMVNTDLNISKLLTQSYGLGLSSSLANELSLITSRTMSVMVADSLHQVKKSDTSRYHFPILHTALDSTRPFTTQDTVAMRIRAGLSAEHTNIETSLISLVFQGYSPDEAKIIPQLTVDIYNRLSTQNKSRTALKAREFLVKQEKRLNKRITELEDSLRHYQEERSIVAPEIQFLNWIDQEKHLEDKLITEESRLKEIESMLSVLHLQSRRLTTLLQDSRYASLSDKVERIQFTLAELKTEQIFAKLKSSEKQKTEISSSTLTREEQISYLQSVLKTYIHDLAGDSTGLAFSLMQSTSGEYAPSQILQSIQSQISALEIEHIQVIESVQSLTKELKEIKKETQEVPEHLIALASLQRELKISNNLLKTVTKQLAEVQFWNSSQSQKGRILDPPVEPELPYSPNPLLWFLIGGFLSITITTAATYFKIRFSNKITGKSQLEKLSIPLLGVIPDFSTLEEPLLERKESKGHILSDQLAQYLSKDNLLLDSLNRLRMALFHPHIIKATGKRKIIAITSSNKGEGKSTLSCNLATTLEHFGKRVLIVDLDLHRPTIHKIFDIHRSPGLSDLLADQAQIADCIYSTPLNNLYILPAGKKSVDPVKLIESNYLLEMLNEVSKSFAHVIIDTPPYGLVADSAHFIHNVDCLLLAARYNVTNLHELNITLESLLQINAPVTGSVLTAAPTNELMHAKSGIGMYVKRFKKRSSAYDYQ